MVKGVSLKFYKNIKEDCWGVNILMVYSSHELRPTRLRFFGLSSFFLTAVNPESPSMEILD
jgi:hypothetical protein